MDITVSIITRQSDHELPVDEGGGRWKLGQILCLYESAKIIGIQKQGDEYWLNPVCDHLGFVHITDVPQGVNMAWFEALLTEPQNDGNNKLTLRSKWCIPVSILRGGKEVTIAWGQAKALIKNKVSGRSITDMDLTS